MAAILHLRVCKKRRSSALQYLVNLVHAKGALSPDRVTRTDDDNPYIKEACDQRLFQLQALGASRVDEHAKLPDFPAHAELDTRQRNMVLKNEHTSLCRSLLKLLRQNQCCRDLGFDAREVYVQGFVAEDLGFQ